MGYYVSTNSVNFTIPSANIEPALAAILAMDQNLRDANATGATYPGKFYTSHWDWMNQIDIQAQTGPQGLVNIFTQLGFECTTINDDGDLLLGWYDAKTGDEEHFLETVAPFVTPGSYIEWEGEDDTYWRLDFDGSSVKTSYGTIVYS